jgi:hypothetical protein
MDRMMIIALDGLEPSLVTETMANLRQSEHGLTDVDVSPLQTPLIWATFLTGTKDNGVKRIGAPFRLEERISRFIGYERVANISRFTSELGLYDLQSLSKYIRQYTNEDLTQPTIFDAVEKSVALDIPAYNENPVYLTIRRKIALSIRGQYPENDFLSEVWDLFRNEYDECLNTLEDEWDLFMVHFFITDVIGHLSWNDVEKLKTCYHAIDEKIGEIQRRIPQSVILIVSDHGMQRGLHTRTGFYSLNTHLNLNSPKITEFYDIIRMVLRR